MTAIEASLKRLGPTIDLCCLHRPDPATPIEETLRALDDLVRAGKVRYAACSNLTGPQLTEALDIAQRHADAPHSSHTPGRIQPAQPAIEPDLMPVIGAARLGLDPLFPAGSGLLAAARYRKGKPLPAGTRLTEGRLAERFVTEHDRDIAERFASVLRRTGPDRC